MSPARPPLTRRVHFVDSGAHTGALRREGTPMTTPALKVLVVDDDATARIVLRAALRQAGFEVGLAVGGEDALRQFGAQRWDLVMLDVEMPDLSGHEVCAKLRARAGELLPIVMVTGMDDVDSVEKAYNSGATDFIAKPINRALIGHHVKYLLRGAQAMLDLQSANARNAAILQALPDPLFEVDIDGRIVDFHAPRLGRALGKLRQTVIGKTVGELLAPEAAQVCMAALSEAHTTGRSIGQQFELRLPRGHQWFELSVSSKAGVAEQKPHFIALARDITERKESEQAILRLAHFDGLTGLPNRQSFLERVNREIKRAQRKAGKLAVLFMDLDGFKNINDSMGHGVGDKILQSVADRLRECVRPSDMVSRATEPGSEVELARLGGDEFTALVLDLERAEDAMNIARRILETMQRPFALQGRDVGLSTSIGIALYPQDGEDAVTLLEHADTAMYHAKASGRGQCEFYSAALTERAVLRMSLESSLRVALERNEFHLCYQPQIDAASGRIHSVEALIRWAHPERGLIAPLDFIPLAEENGLIVPIGKWVLKTACADAARWQRAGHSVRVAVNLSPLQFKDPTLVQTVVQTCTDTGLAPQQLELEITEGAILQDTKATMATLEAFRDHGVCIALDDFGTGYSSLSYLKRMPLSHIKVDRSFVSGLPDDADSRAIVSAILAMADSLGISVVAEGVETLAQAQALKRMSCATLQGYFFSKPMAAANIPALLGRRWSLEVQEQGLTPVGRIAERAC